jgi:hypothetical protein
VDKNLAEDSNGGKLVRGALREITNKVPIVLSLEETELVPGGIGHIGGPPPTGPGPGGIV